MKFLLLLYSLGARKTCFACQSSLEEESERYRASRSLGPKKQRYRNATAVSISVRAARFLPLIGVGGVASAEDAYAKIRAGASLVQLYTALVFAGPALVSRIKAGLVRLLRRDGFASVSEAVGTCRNAAPA